MKALANRILLSFFMFSLAAGLPAAPGKASALPAPTPPQKQGDRPAPPASTQTTMRVTPAVAAPITNTPQHTPDLLDFGVVSEGSSAKRTFSLITNAPGYVTVNIPPGPFRLVEFREMGPAPGSKNSGAQPALPAVGGARSRIKYQEGQNGPYQWSMAPNTEMQIDIVFTPKPPSGPAAVSQLTTLNATGPGPHGNWALVIPLRGTLNPLKLTPEGPQSKAAGNNIGSVVMSGKPASGPGTAAPSTARKLSSAEALQHMRSAGKPVLVATVRNSKLSQNGIDMKTLAQLRQQKQTADQERPRIIATRGAGQTTKSMGAGGATNVGVANSQMSGVGTGNNISQSASAPVPNVLVCAKAAPDALIFSINGQKKGVVFTTDPDNNLFTFTGCNFGDTQGSIHLYGGFAHGNIPFEISFWNDKGIVARVQPDLAGELDRDNITLVLVSGNGHQTAFQGYKFYAARQTYKLASIPNASSKIIFGPPDVFNCQVADGWTFWYCGVDSPGHLATVDVSRSGVKGDKGTDQFSISGLKPGFEISDVSLWISPEVGGKQGWSMNSFAENISVNYVFGWKNPDATYGLGISVTGPRGLDSVWK